MKVNVSWKDINNGIPNDQENCAVACALMRKFKTTDVSIYYDGHYCDNNKHETVGRDGGRLTLRVGADYYDTNYIDNIELLEEFVSDYDTDGQSVSPITFNMDI
mgnify:FL=1